MMFTFLAHILTGKQAMAGASGALHVPSMDEMQNSRLGAFKAFAQTQMGVDFGAPGPDGYAALHRWSAEHLEDFHRCVWDFCGIIGDQGQRAIDNPHSILEAKFFPDSKICFAENMLARAETHPDDAAIISRTAGIEQDRILSWAELCDAVSVWEQALGSLGVGEGDRVATYLPHGPEAYIVMMAAAQRGAVFSSVGTEMGAQASAARFAQIRPKVLVAADGYMHMKRAGEPGKAEDRMELIAELQKDVVSIERTVVVENLHQKPDISGLKNAVLAADLLQQFSARKLEFVRRDFNQPLAILFSSGSTGKPKCFVHGVGGTLLKHAIEHQLQSDVRPGDRVFFHSTTSWMMFNWLASGLAQGATIMIYDGNPAYPGADAQLQFAAEYRCTHLGTAAAIIQDVWAKGGVDARGMDLSALRSLMYTGSVLSDQGFVYVDQHIKKGLSINGVCGGTDFVGCYAAGNPFVPTVAGQLKGPVLGMDIDVWDDTGAVMPVGQAGELVVKSGFASRPLYFWNDGDGTRFRGEYFEHFKCNPPVWRHGDAVKKCEGGQLVVEGRSDTTLNQGGVRIGTQQLYDALAHPSLAGVIEDALAASFKDAQGGDHTALFVVLKDRALDEGLQKQIKSVISDSVGRLSCPHEVLAVPYVLKTPNGKKAEKPTSQLLNGKDTKAPETYGHDPESGALKTALFGQIGADLRAKAVYGFLAA
ncbi:MAG: acetoacetate--CoA ligase [Rhodospirillales bacterium]|nr:acetoacetate--CoA ligase [Rhodospirillales bacterium]